MKKNILSIIILAATLVNTTLTAVMLFVYLPNAQKMNNLITKVVQIIDLELEDPLPSDVTAENSSEVKIADLTSIAIEDEMTIPLTKGDDGTQHYGVITATIVLNKTATDYKNVSTQVTDNEARVKEIIQDEISKLTIDTFTSGKDTAKANILKTLQNEFGTECIYRVDFGSYLAS